MKRLLFVLPLLLMLAGCLTQADQEEEAGKIVEQVHQAFASGDWDSILPLYDKKFFADKSPESWKQQLDDMRARLGKLRNIEPTFQQKDPRFSGEYYLFGSLLRFEHGNLRETLTIFRGINADRLVISGHLLKMRMHAQKK